MRWRLIKTWVTQRYGTGSPRPIIRTLWQVRYWEHLIRDDQDYQQHVEYIHYNPVKHGYVRKPVAWPYSSFRQDVRDGLYSDRSNPIILNPHPLPHRLPIAVNPGVAAPGRFSMMADYTDRYLSKKTAERCLRHATRMVETLAGVLETS